MQVHIVLTASMHLLKEHEGAFLPAAKPAGLCFANVLLLGDYLVSGCASGCASGCVSYSGCAGGCVI